MSSNHVEDRLTMLAEDIRVHILSLMPTKFAVRTSVLSKKWRYSWMFVTNLNFEDIDGIGGDKILSESVDQVIELCKSPQIQLFRLHFSEWSCRERLNVSNWIDKALTLNVRELEIDNWPLSLPTSIFTCKTLTRLKLDCCIDNLPSVYLPCLETLEMIEIMSSYGEAFKLIYGCPVLENLSLEEGWRFQDEEKYIFNIPTLKKLKLKLPKYEYVVDKVILNVPNLEYLFVYGQICSNFVMEDVSSLVDAYLPISIFPIDHHMWVDLVHKLSGITSLSVSNLPFDSDLPIFPNMKHLEINVHSGLIFQFLENCPKLKHLYIKPNYHTPWDDWKSVPSCVLTNLTTIKFWNCYHDQPDIQFLEYMLRNAKVLKTVRINLICPSDLKEQVRLCESLQKLPRASKHCEIHFDT